MGTGTGAILLFGFLLGLRHALESDHVATVASLATRTSSVRETARVAAAWGVGHAATLVVAGAALFAFGASLPVNANRALDGLVGCTLVALGMDVLRRLRARREHLHVHRHGDGARHWHVHAHTDGRAHDPAHHEHPHDPRLVPRAALIGGLHGMAGSAALTLLALQALPSLGAALLYLGVFGLGSVLGMLMLSLVIALPFHVAGTRLGGALLGLEVMLGSASVVLGGWIVVAAARAAGG